MKYSEEVSRFLKFVETAKSDYNWNKQQMEKQEALTQDYLHQLELEHLDYKERAKVATKLAQCRKDRREAKDVVESLEPFINYINAQEKPLNLLRETLGKIMKEEQKTTTRTYRFKVLEKESITNG